MDSMEEEKISVSVRVRPLSEREVNRNDFTVWELSSHGNTIAYTYNNTSSSSSSSGRSSSSSSSSSSSHFPQLYTFDRVFGADTTTKEVYEKGAKDVALSVLAGKNATVFAYGQTSSGKTYTMRGITEYTTDDIFAYIEQNKDRSFLLKFSALEIYNEVVTDLLNYENLPLRLMDDPERGTVIEKLEEQTITDKDHLQSLLAICEAHRQVGETSLNDCSSRSHQIIRLSIESSPRVVSDAGPTKSLIAILNFVDLAGSERASLTHSEGARLKEGCHINRSLLTLSTVIRKLSDSNRMKVGHLPYRDSKLTRILQNSLGGNARTAIICTMSASNRHIEQTKNTLFFASCAKEVTNRAQVNMVVSDKEFIKQLKREVALLEAKLHLSTYSTRASSDALLMEKDLYIQKMQDEMHKALQQRDLVQSRLDSVLKQMEAREQARALALSRTSCVDTSPSSSLEYQNMQTPSSSRSLEGDDDMPWKQDAVKQVNASPLVKYNGENPNNTSASAMLLQEIYKLEHLQSELAQDAHQALETVKKEFECLRLDQPEMNEEASNNVAKIQAEINKIYESRVTGHVMTDFSTIKDLIVDERRKGTSLKDEIRRIISKEKRKLGDTTEANRICLDKLFANMHVPVEDLMMPKLIPARTPLSTQQNVNESFNSTNNVFDANHQLNLAGTKKIFSLDEKILPQAGENIRNVHAYVTDLKERAAKLQYQKQLLASRVVELEQNRNPEDESVDSFALTLSPRKWKQDFEMKRKQIFQVWDACHVSIVHRSQFYLLFRGDPTDAIYIEVELRRLLWLRNIYHLKINRKSASRVGHVASPSSSLRNLKRERESLVKHLRTGVTSEEREMIYKQWGIPIGAKQRKVRLAHMVWTDPHDDEHIKMSANLVARVIGLWDQNNHSDQLLASKEMFQLSFSPPIHIEKAWYGHWNSISNMFAYYKR